MLELCNLRFNLTDVVHQRIDELESELLQLRNNLGTDGSDAVDLAGSANKVTDRRESPERATTKDPSYSILTPDDLRAPVTAMHAMSPDNIRQHELNQSFFSNFPNPSPPAPAAGDFVSAGRVDEAQARGLFNL